MAGTMQQRSGNTAGSNGAAAGPRYATAKERYDARRERIARNFGLAAAGAVMAVGLTGMLLGSFNKQQPLNEQNIKSPPPISMQQEAPKQGGQAEPPKLWINTPLEKIAADRAYMEKNFPELKELLQSAREAGIFTPKSQFYDTEILELIRDYYSIPSGPENAMDRQTARWHLEVVLGPVVYAALQAQGKAFYPSEVQEVDLPVLEKGSALAKLFSIPGGKVRVDAKGELRTNSTADGMKYAELERTLNIPLMNITKETITITEIRVNGILNDFRSAPIVLKPGEKADIQLNKMPPVVMSTGNYEELPVEVAGRHGKAPFRETSALSLIDVYTTNGNGPLQGFMTPEMLESPRNGASQPSSVTLI